MSSVLDEPRQPKFDEEVMFYYRMGTAIVALSGVCIVFFIGGSILTVIQHQVSGYSLIAFLLGLDSISPIICIASSNKLLLNRDKEVRHHRFLRNFFGLLSAPLVALLLFFGLMRIYMGTIGKILSFNLLFWLGLLFSLLLAVLFMVYFIQTAKILNKEEQ